MKNYKIYVLALFTSLFLASCGSDQPSAPKEEETDKNISPSTEKAELEDTTGATCSGFIIVSPASTITQHAPTEGFVSKINVMPGTHVKKGQVLARLEHQSIIQQQESYLKQKADFAFIDSEFKRKSDLYAQKVISQKEFQEIEAKKKSAAVSLQSMEKQLSFIGISVKSIEANGIQSFVEIRAKTSGTLSKIHVNEGMFTTQNIALFELIDDSQKYVQLQIYSGDVGKVAIGQQIYFSVAGTGKKYPMTIASISNSLNQNNQSLILVSEVLPKNPELVVGSRVFAEI